MIIIDDIIQGTPEWHMEKLGKPSSSNFDKIVTSKGDRSKQRKDYMYRLAGERISGIPTETYSNTSMERGIALEDEARGLFGLLNGGIKIKQVGFCVHDDLKYLCSPDGLLENDLNADGGTKPKEGFEAKCPLIHTHVGYLLANKLPTKYIQQVQGSMLCSGFNSWWFMSYYPELPPLIIKCVRDDSFIEKLKKELEIFCIELDEITQKLEGIK